jgi:hypothetical protein
MLKWNRGQGRANRRCTAIIIAEPSNEAPGVTSMSVHPSLAMNKAHNRERNGPDPFILVLIYLLPYSLKGWFCCAM